MSNKYLEEINKLGGKVSEKLNKLEELYAIDKLAYEQAGKEIVNSYKLCPDCNEYYKEKSFTQFTKKEIRRVCTCMDAGYGDDDIWENKEVSVYYEECPVGHIRQIHTDRYALSY